MAHHQGMSLVAIGNVLQRQRDGPAVPRRADRPGHRAAPAGADAPRRAGRAPARGGGPGAARTCATSCRPSCGDSLRPSDPTPRTHVLSNGRYAVMVTAAGSGYSRWRDIAVSRWREDVTRDAWGTYLYLRDARNGDVWSAGHQPSCVEADSYEVIYSEDRAEFSRRDGSMTTELTVIVSAEDDAEIRRVSLTNLGSRSREIELTSYAEIVLAPQAADVAHPAFQNLFVQTEFVPRLGALVATRRPRSRGERQIWAAHVSALEDHAAGAIQYETDRARFLGRGRSVREPGVGGRWAPPLEHRGSGPRPDLQPPSPGPARARWHGPRGLLDRGRRVTGCGPGPGRQVPRTSHLRASRDPGLDAGPGPAASPGHRDRRCAPVPAARQPDHLLGPVAPAGARDSWHATSVGRPGSGPGASPATCPSSSSGSTVQTTSTSSDSCCAPTSTGG